MMLPLRMCHRLKRSVADNRSDIRTAEGFTLVEMTVVLALIALAGTALAVTLAGRQPHPRDLARSIAAEARAARQIAVSSGNETALVIDLAKREISIEQRDNAIVVPETVNLSVTVAQELISNTAAGRIVFYPDGSASGGEITLETQTAGKYTVRIFWLTGTSGVKAEP